MKKKIETAILPYTNFYIAEDYHQKYYLQLHRAIADEYKRCLGSVEAFVASTATARVNGYIKGYGTMEGLHRELPQLGLSEAAEKRLEQIVEGYGR